MASGNVYKPRYTLPYLAKSKVWPTKNSRLRRFVSLRGRRLQRGGLFRRYVLVITTLKWTEARRQIRPIRRRTGYGITGGGITALGRPRKRRYRDSFYTKQQVRAFHGKITESALRSIVHRHRTGLAASTGAGTRSFAAALGARLDIVLFRIRFRPTIYACHQFVRHTGVSVNGSLSFAPQSTLRIGDTISLVPTAIEGYTSNFKRARLEIWRAFYWDRFVRLYYRRWGLYLFRRRIGSQLRSKIRPFARPFNLQLPIFVGSNAFGTQTNKIVPNFSVFRTRLTSRAASSSLNPRALVRFRHFLKVWLALRLRTSFLPRVRSIASTQETDSRSNRAGSFYLRPSRRKSRRRFRLARRAKVERRRKLVRLQPVHIVFPSYLQRDLRTLRATRVYEPTSEEIVFPFRGSVAQIQAFYRSRGR